MKPQTKTVTDYRISKEPIVITKDPQHVVVNRETGDMYQCWHSVSPFTVGGILNHAWFVLDDDTIVVSFGPLEIARRGSYEKIKVDDIEKWRKIVNEYDKIQSTTKND